MFNMYERSHNLNYYIPCAGEETILRALNCSINLSTSSMNPDGVLCVALEVAQGSTGCCCIVHCVHQQRASLRLVVNSNQVQNTLTGPFPRHSDTCAVCSDFSSHSRWDWYICAMAISLKLCCYRISCIISLPPTSTCTCLLFSLRC